MERSLSTRSSACSSQRSTSSHPDFGMLLEGSGEAWEENTPNCGACGARLGKLRRHHCRICGMCICAACSPNSVQLEGQRRLQRACTPCVSSACHVPTVKRRLAQLAGALRALGGAPAGDGEAATLLEAAALCEGAVLPVETALAAERARAERAEAALDAEMRRREELQADGEAAAAVLRRLGERMLGAGGHATPGQGAVKAQPEQQHAPAPLALGAQL